MCNSIEHIQLYGGICVTQLHIYIGVSVNLKKTKKQSIKWTNL